MTAGECLLFTFISRDDSDWLVLIKDEGGSTRKRYMIWTGTDHGYISSQSVYSVLILYIVKTFHRGQMLSSSEDLILQ